MATKPVVNVSGEQLSCAGQDLEAIPPELAREYGSRIRRLDMSSNQLKSLENLEGFERIQELILDDNLIDDNCSFPAIAQLATLSLNKNRITDIERLIGRVSVSYPQLRFLSLLGNRACPNELVSGDEDDYRRYRCVAGPACLPAPVPAPTRPPRRLFVIARLPKLRFLDSRSVTAEERAEAKRVGVSMTVARPREDDDHVRADVHALTAAPAANVALTSASAHRRPPAATMPMTACRATSPYRTN